MLFSVLVINLYNPDTVSKLPSILSNFINIQISAIAILISFSIAIMTILISSSSMKIEELKKQYDEHNNYKKLKNAKNDSNGQISLFQVLLSNITYNIFVEVIYLIVLIILVIVQIAISPDIIPYIISICIFLIIHILYVLLESVTYMYLTFWN